MGLGGYVHYLDCGVGFTVVFIDKNLSNCTLYKYMQLIV